MKPRAVLDTNVLVSGLLGGTATDVIRKWRARAFELVLTEEIMSEYEAVLNRPQFRLPLWVVQELLDRISQKANWVVPASDIGANARDPSDNKFLEAAVAGQVDWLVSGDNDLLDIEEFEGILIIPPWEFLSRL
jgi:putative PIN family toxin of toxin-antitoxin system